MISSNHLNYLQSVNNLSIKNIGLTGKNPSVACLIVDYSKYSKGIILSYGLTSKNVTGKDAEESLERAGMTCNKNGVANDPNPPTITSGIRLGSPAATTRGFKEEEFKFIGEKISTIINNLSVSNSDISMLESSINKEVQDLCSKYPIY